VPRVAGARGATSSFPFLQPRHTPNYTLSKVSVVDGAPGSRGAFEVPVPLFENSPPLCNPPTSSDRTGVCVQLSLPWTRWAGQPPDLPVDRPVLVKPPHAPRLGAIARAGAALTCARRLKEERSGCRPLPCTLRALAVTKSSPTCSLSPKLASQEEHSLIRSWPRA
jgi:hypothetical protein